MAVIKLPSPPFSPSEKQSVSPNGITAITTKAGKNEMNGARLCRNLSAFGGMKSSLKIVFKPSAAGCSKPAKRKPTRGSSLMLIAAYSAPNSTDRINRPAPAP